MPARKGTLISVPVYQTRLFYSARLKIKRAKHHIADLEKAIRLFVESNPHSSSVTEDGQSGQKIVNINFGKFPPPNIALITSDAIHNLRTALEHANWELRGLDGGKQHQWVKLPVGDDRIKYEAACNGIETPTGDLPDFFRAFEFYKGGRGELIYSLHGLDVMEKHVMLSIGASRSTKVTWPDGAGFLQVSVPHPNDPVKPSKPDQNTDLALDICFGDVEGFKLKPILPTLVQLTDAVEHVIVQFEALVASRRTKPAT